MFTGLIQEVGEVLALGRGSGRTRLEVRAPALAREPFVTGESIAVDGCCVTVVSSTADAFAVEVSPETLSRTSLGSLRSGAPVNLERALRLSDRLGGHLVLGHVDGLGRVVSKKPAGDFVELGLEAPEALAPLLLEKGSIAVDGVSLTVNSVTGRRFTVMLIPETLSGTSLGSRKPGDAVNLEGDVIGKYVARLLARSGKSSIDPAFLEENGFA